MSRKSKINLSVEVYLFVEVKYDTVIFQWNFENAIHLTFIKFSPHHVQ